MRQQVNLYILLPKERKWRFTKETLIVCYAVFVFLLLFNVAFKLWNRHSLQRDLNQAIVTQTRLTDQLNSLAKQEPLIDLNDLTGSVKKIVNDINANQKLSQVLSYNVSFSSYLSALTTAIVPDVWLTEIQFNASDQLIILRGSALRAASIQQFLERLSRQPVFSKLQFNMEDLTETVVENQQNSFNFVISTKPVKQS